MFPLLSFCPRPAARFFRLVPYFPLGLRATSLRPRPCARCRTSKLTFSFCLYSDPDPFCLTTPCSLSPARHTIRQRVNSRFSSLWTRSVYCPLISSLSYKNTPRAFVGRQVTVAHFLLSCSACSLSSRLRLCAPGRASYSPRVSSFALSRTTVPPHRSSPRALTERRVYTLLSLHLSLPERGSGFLIPFPPLYCYWTHTQTTRLRHIVLPDTTIPYLEEDGSNWATFAACFREAIHRWSYFNGTVTRPLPKDPAHPTNAESAAITEWNHEDAIAQCLLTERLPDTIEIFLIEVDCQTAKACWDQLAEKLDQSGSEDSWKWKEKGLTGEPPAATALVRHLAPGRIALASHRHSDLLIPLDDTLLSPMTTSKGFYDDANSIRDDVSRLRAHFT